MSGDWVHGLGKGQLGSGTGITSLAVIRVGAAADHNAAAVTIRLLAPRAAPCGIQIVPLLFLLLLLFVMLRLVQGLRGVDAGFQPGAERGGRGRKLYDKILTAALLLLSTMWMDITLICQSDDMINTQTPKHRKQEGRAYLMDFGESATSYNQTLRS